MKRISVLNSVIIAVFAVVAFGVLAVSASAYTNETSKNVHPEQMTVSERYKYMNSIVNAIVEQNNLTDIGDKFTSDCYSKLLRLDIDFPGSVYFMVNDSIRVENSSNKDYVLISNVKVQNGDVNNIFAFEFHINIDGKIYGFNIWSY